jgi:FtsX-like permease family protein
VTTQVNWMENVIEHISNTWLRPVAAVMLVGLCLSGAVEAADRDSGNAQTFLEREIRKFSAIPSRLSGTPGCDQAADYIVRRFGEIGLKNITRQPFDVVVPITKKCTLNIGDAQAAVEIHPLWPNLVRTCTTPGPISAPIIYAADGDYRKLKGLPVEGSIVVIEHNTGAAWQRVAALGARAFIFVEPRTRYATRKNAEMKFLDNPVNIPRFWVPKTSGKLAAQGLVDRVTAAQKAGKPLVAKLDCRVDWEKRTAHNIVGLLEGTKGTVASGNFVAYSAYYDSISIAPDLAPGADTSSSIASLLLLAERLAAKRGEEGVMFIATAGHYQKLAGATVLADTLGYSTTPEADSDEPDELTERIKELQEDEIDVADRIEGYDGIIKEIEDVPEIGQAATDEMLALVKKLKTRITDATTSQPVYDELLKVLAKANKAVGLDAADERSVRFAIGRELDAERHVAYHRFELLRLRRHKKFLDELKIDLKKRLRIVCSLELSADGSRFAVLHEMANSLVSQKVDQAIGYGPLFQQIWQIGRTRMAGTQTADGLGAKFYQRVIYPIRNEERLEMGVNSFFASHLAFDSEMFQLAGRLGFAFATADSGRRRVDTPTDTAELIEKDGGFKRLAGQAELLWEIIDKTRSDLQIVNMYRSYDAKRASGEPPLKDQSCRINGRVVLYDVKKSMGAADQPISGAICVARHHTGIGNSATAAAVRTAAGVRGAQIVVSDAGGTFEMLGLPHGRTRAYRMQSHQFEAYTFAQKPPGKAGEPELGEITRAPDRGPQGAKLFNIHHPKIKRDDYEITIPVFVCRPVALIGFTDPLLGKGFTNVSLYDAKTKTAPDFWGISIFPSTFAKTHAVPNAVLYVQAKTRFKLQFTAGALGSTSPLLNVRPDHIGLGDDDDSVDGENAGYGYYAPTTGLLSNSRHLTVRDVVNLDEYRIGALKEHAVENSRVNELHFGLRDKDDQLVKAGSTQRLAAAEKALARRDYSNYLVELESAYAYESRAYPIVKGTTTDILTGVLFYLFLLLPFSYFAERLLFGFPSVNKRIMGFFAIFIVVFMVLAIVHPAFALTQSAPVILIAFITLALSALVIMMIRGRFEVEIKRLHERPGARRQGDFTRASATSAACALGIGNMRRRKVRTSLTLATLVLLTFSVLSFTSVDPRQITHENPNPTGQTITPPYKGILVRSPKFLSLSNYFLELLQNEFQDTATVVPRAWYGTDVLIQSTADPRIEYLATGLVGMVPDETKATQPHKRLRAGRWFKDGEMNVCIIGHDMAKQLQIDEALVTGDVAGAPRVRMLGLNVPVIGITDDKKFDSLIDVDGEAISPVDRRKETWMRTSGKKFDPYAIESYQHVDAARCVFVPYNLLMEYGASLISVAVRTETDEQAEEVGRSLLSRMTVPIYIAARGRVTYSLSSDANRVRGMGALIVPMLICALIVLNTMLGSVYERQREISIFGSLGLAPLHIGSLFMAESAVFATIAVILGYVLGQSVSFLVTANELIEGFSLNYSSTSAVVSAAAVMALVLLSTIYPARKASQLSVPDVERVWKLPAPDGDHFHIEFPFTVGGQQAFGINMFLMEYFLDHANQSVGDFFAQDTTMTREKIDGHDVVRFDSQVWIAPFDFGISQSLSLYTIPTDEEGIYAPDMHLYRKSGEPAAWARMNNRFLKLIRQQFLMWRILSVEEREFYAAQAKVKLGMATDEDRRVIEDALKAEPAPADKPAEDAETKAEETQV